MSELTKNLYNHLPDSPGIYLMKNGAGRVLYVGKAGSLRRRVASYFLLARHSLGGGGRANDARVERLVREVKKIDYQKTDTAIEALILEAKLIKKLSPPFNIREKDDKSFLYVEITKEPFPRVFLVRGREARINADLRTDKRGRKIQYALAEKQYGPFTSASSIRAALRILRRIFPWSTHTDPKLRMHPNPQKVIRRFGSNSDFSDRLSAKRACFDYEIGLCPGTCIGAISKKNYRKNILNLKLFFEGKKKKVLRSLEKEMRQASKKQEFEQAAKLRRQIFALNHIRDVALVTDDQRLTTNDQSLATRIEGYDISNISGTSAVGSMVVFRDGQPDKSEYRKFKIKTIVGSNDVAMLAEVLRRRFSHSHSKTVIARSRATKQFSRNIGTPGLPRSPLSLAMTKEGSHAWPLPSLILVDGGASQVNAAKSVLVEVGLKITVVGIAKGPKRKRNDFIGFVPKWTDKRTLIRVRDEAHRFAVEYHKKLRGREFLR